MSNFQIRHVELARTRIDDGPVSPELVDWAFVADEKEKWELIL
jgi:hypothetical protein